MPAVPSPLPLLVADIGGTHARFALAEAPANERGAVIALRDLEVLSVSSFEACSDAIAAYLADRGVQSRDLRGACLAVASPVGDDEIRFTNSSWRFSSDELRKRFGLRRLHIINDFEALAWQVPRCDSGSVRVLRAGVIHPEAARVVLGPGTGLGVAGLKSVRSSSGSRSWVPLPGEGGHVGFAPVDDLEIRLLQHLQRIYGRVSIERIVSGPGLAMLHQFMCRQQGVVAEAVVPELISRRALEGGDPLALETLHRFLGILGGFAADMALAFGAVGGVYLGGGILPRLEPLFPASPFFQRFDDKGRYSRWVAQIPITLIVDDTAALRGAAVSFETFR